MLVENDRTEDADDSLQRRKNRLGGMKYAKDNNDVFEIPCTHFIECAASNSPSTKNFDRRL
jgi:hypothetical protein